MDDWRVYVGMAVIAGIVVWFVNLMNGRWHVAVQAGMHHDEQVTERTRAPFTPQAPMLHTYSPHVQQQLVPGPERAPLALADPVVGESLAAAPAFATLLAQGLIGPGRPLLLGYSADGPLVGGWKDLYSSAVAGVSGSGKTTTLRFLAAQSAAQGARFLILDPHADAGDESLAGTLAPLAPAFLAPFAADPPAMLHLLSIARFIMQVRLHGGQVPVELQGWGGLREALGYLQALGAAPLIVAVDEFTALMGRSDLAGPLAALIEAIAQEGRKVRCFALVSGQIFTAARSGSTALRDALASAYIHRMKRAQARLLIGAEDAARAEGLRAGQALLARANGDVIAVTIPDTTAADITHVAALLTGATTPATEPLRPATAAATEWPPRPPVVVGDVVDTVAEPGAGVVVVDGKPVDSKTLEQIREGIAAGQSAGETAQGITGSKGGDRYGYLCRVYTACIVAMRDELNFYRTLAS